MQRLGGYMALSPKDLQKKLNQSFKTKKLNSQFGTGWDIVSPTFFIKAPKDIKLLLGDMHYPGKRIIQISGKPNSGKSTLGMLAMVEAQKGYYDKEDKFIEEPCAVILVDTEQKFPVQRFVKMGGNPDELFLINYATLEENFHALFEALKMIFEDDKERKVLVVFDSVGQNPTLKETMMEIDDTQQPGVAGKVLRRNARVLVAKYMSRFNIVFLGINTSYPKIGSHGRANSGGEGFEFASACIMQLGRMGDISPRTVNGKKVTDGIKVKARSTKNHLQNSEYCVKEVEFEVRAYEVRSMDKFSIKKNMTFTNQTSRIDIEKAGKSITYMLYQEDEEPQEISISKKELMDLLEREGYEQVTSDTVE